MSQTRAHEQTNRLVVAISGASGAAIGIRALELLAEMQVETHLVLSKAGERTIVEETGMAVSDARALASVVHPAADIGASIASGSFLTRGMLIAPTSIRTMGEIATGVTSTLVTRAADVVLKERRRLVLMVRETPLHTGHLRTMTALSEMGAVIMPPVPAFYAQPETVDDIVTQAAARALDQFDFNSDRTLRWRG